MSSPEPAASSPIDSLRARFLRLASDPRAGLIPEGRATLTELVHLLDQVADLDIRLAAIERALSRALRSEANLCDES